MSAPFALNIGDASRFQAAVGYDTLYNLPPWGGIFQWESRFILVFPKPDGSFAFTDISNGIPDSSVPGGYIPASALVQNVNVAYVSPTVAFFSSLPQNFINVARERLQQVGTAVADVVHDVAAPIIQSAADAVAPISGGLILALGIAAAVLFFVYMPKKSA